MYCSLPGFSIHGIFQARVPEWVAIPFSRESSQPRDQTRFSHQADALPSEPRSIDLNFIPLLPSFFFFHNVIEDCCFYTLSFRFFQVRVWLLTSQDPKVKKLLELYSHSSGLAKFFRYSRNSMWHSDACCKGKYKLKLRSLLTCWKISERKRQESPLYSFFSRVFKEM